jgi:hypothetical protein
VHIWDLCWDGKLVSSWYSVLDRNVILSNNESQAFRTLVNRHPESSLLVFSPLVNFLKWEPFSLAMCFWVVLHNYIFCCNQSGQFFIDCFVQLLQLISVRVVKLNEHVFRIWPISLEICCFNFTMLFFKVLMKLWLSSVV